MAKCMRNSQVTKNWILMTMLLRKKRKKIIKIKTMRTSVLCMRLLMTILSRREAGEVIEEAAHIKIKQEI